MRTRSAFSLVTLSCAILLGSHPPCFAQTPPRSNRTASVITPVWYNEPPAIPDTLIARGKGRSSDEQSAIDKAVAEARSALARTIDHRWEELLRTIEKEGGAHLAWTHEPVTLTGSAPRTQKLVKRGGTWTAYVLVGMPESSARNVLLQRLHGDASWYNKVRETPAVRACEASAP